MNIPYTTIVHSVSLTLALTLGVGNAVAKNIEPSGVQAFECDGESRLPGIEELYECYIRPGFGAGKNVLELPDGVLDEKLLSWFDEERGDKNYVNFYPNKRSNTLYRLFQDVNTKKFWVFLVSERANSQGRGNREGG